MKTIIETNVDKITYEALKQISFINEKSMPEVFEDCINDYLRSFSDSFLDQKETGMIEFLKERFVEIGLFLFMMSATALFITMLYYLIKQGGTYL